MYTYLNLRTYVYVKEKIWNMKTRPYRGIVLIYLKKGPTHHSSHTTLVTILYIRSLSHTHTHRWRKSRGI